MTEVTTYNLLDEPWIQALDLDGQVTSVSVREAITRAGSLRRLAGELPTQDAAILRLILAVLHRALPVEGDDEVVMDTWGQWWRAGSVPTQQVLEYLDEWHDRFDLLGGDHPFFQVPDLHTASGSTSGLGKVIADLPAGHKFFTNRAGAGAEWLSRSEGARWLVHCQAFDPSGIKTGAVGDPRVKGGRGYPIGTGWSGNLGVVVLEGSDLSQTLLLNLVLERKSADDDTPPWEIDDWTAAPTGSDSPRGPAQAMTWQARRIRLIHRGDRVDDVIISNGDALRVRNQQHVETMSAWRRSAAQEKKHGEALAYMPQEHRLDRAIWRGLDSLVAAAPVGAGSSRGETALRSANISWVAALRRAGHLQGEDPVSIQTVGVVYGSNSSVIDTVVSDRITLQTQVLAEPDLQDAAVRAARTAEVGARLVGQLAGNLARAEGRERDGEVRTATEDAFQRFDPMFRAWASSLKAQGLAAYEEDWREQVRREAWHLGHDRYATASPSAIRGRIVSDGRGNDIRIDAGLAHSWFARALRTEVPLLRDEAEARADNKQQEDGNE